MREYAVAAPDRPPSGNLADDLVRNAAQAPDRVAYSVRRVTGAEVRWTDVTWAEFHDAVRSAARGLVAAGLQPGDRVVLLSRTRYEWTLLDYAFWYAGLVGVPAYDTSSDDHLLHLMRDCDPAAVVVETRAHRDRLRDAFQAARTAGRRLHLWTIEDAGAGPALEVLGDVGSAIAEAELDARRAGVGPDDLATLVYTSGTTGPPKGCRLTHGGFAAGLGAVVPELPEVFGGEDAATLLLLPLPHVLARAVQVGAVAGQVRVGHVPDTGRLLDDLAGFRPTFLLGVPRILERVFDAASQRATAAGRGRAFDRATEVAIRWSTALDDGGPGIALRAQHALHERLVYNRFREALGGRCRYAFSGGAPLGERLAHFYRGAGVPVVEGYGLSETTGPTTIDDPEALRVGTVGRPIPGSAVRVAEDGELLVRGPHVMQGYWRDPSGTAAVLRPDGWLATGDLGEIDAEGYVRVSGRKDEVLVTTGGKAVSPAVLEDRLRAHPLVDQCLVVGDGRPYVAALVTLDAPSLSDWAGSRGKPTDPATLVDDPELGAVLQAAVDEVNAGVSPAESIRRFRVLPVTWGEEGGELTPSLKLRRSAVLRRHRRDIESLYR